MELALILINNEIQHTLTTMQLVRSKIPTEAISNAGKATQMHEIVLITEHADSLKGELE